MSAQIPPRGPVLPAVLGMVAFSVVAAVLVTVSVTPMIAVSSVTAQSAIGIFNNLPSYISIGKLPGPNTIYAQSGGKPVAVATIFDENRQQVAWDDISQAAKDSAVDGEDRRFYSHGAVDPTGIIRAALAGAGASSGSQQGASTIAQQLVKNLAIQDALQEPTLALQTKGIKDAIAPTLGRKLLEAKLAISLEKKYSKQDILLAYLNIAPFGGTTYGIEAAAQRYYGITAKQLTPVESATLIAIVQNPNQKAPTGKAGYAANTPRRNDILGQMLAAKSITKAQHDDAIKVVESAKTIKNIAPKQGCTAALDNAQFWCAYVKTLYPSLAAFGANAADRAKNWKIGGYKIYTSLDVNLQNAAQQVENTWVPSSLPTMDIGGATSSVEVGTGRILVMVENRAFNETTTKTVGTTAINYNVDQKNGGSAYGFQGGSTYKPFTLINWLQNGHGLNDLVDATPNPNLALSQFKDSCANGYGGTYGKYTNDEGEKGPWTVMRATANSVNGVFLNMGKLLDQCQTMKDAEAFGVHQGHTDTSDPSGFLPLQHQPSAILGTNSVAPLTMAAAYAGIANGGVFCQPIAIDSVVSPEGAKLPGQTKTCTSALDPGIDAAVGVAMQGVFSGGTAGAARPAGVAVLGKTGTTNKSLETWTVGSTTRVSTAVWIGNATGQVPTRNTRPPVHCPGTANQVATLRNCVFKHTMEAIDTVYPPGKFPPAPAQYLSGTTVGLPDFTGQTVTAATAQLQALGFEVNVEPGEFASAEPEGTVAATDPGAGGKYAPGYLINIYTSDGSLSKTVPNVTGDPFFVAQAAIAAAGFTANAVQGCAVTTDPTKVGKAISTDPVQGWQGPASTRVTVKIGQLGPCP